MNTFHCDYCDQQVFFENVRCEQCGHLLGYQPEQGAISSFEAFTDWAGALPAGGVWRTLHPANAGKLYKQCINYAQRDACNWMQPLDAGSDYCAACRLTRTIPALTSEKNLILWRRLEAAKRRLLYTLWQLHLQPVPKSDRPDIGLSFEFLEDMPACKVMTGHANGVITINIAEADPAHRERMREQMSETYRTLLGHFRHEIGHYYFDRLLAGTPRIDAFRALFGDERQDYAQSLQRHYENGPAADWSEHFVSAYASSHPWEDWAETWAHYLHLIDTLDTAHASGMSLHPRKRNEPQLRVSWQPVRQQDFDRLMSEWLALTTILNSLNRSIGMPDAYPFTLSTPVIDKLRFVHTVVQQASHHTSME